MSKNIGVLWVREYEKDGEKRKMLSGEIDLGILGSARIAVFKNSRKEKDNHPDYRIVLSKQQDNQERKDEMDEYQNRDRDNTVEF